MLTRIQIRADGDTAHDVENELQAARLMILRALNMDNEGRNLHQVIEGSPGQGFSGRLTFAPVESKVVAF